MTGVHLVTSSAEETQALGRRLGKLVAVGDILLLHGDLGAGKTTLARGLITAGRSGIAVQSPTFTLINQYGAIDDRPALYHLDLYRLNGPDDLDSIGLDDLIAAGDGVMLIEWPERLGADLPDDYLLVSIEPDGPNRRQIDVQAIPPDGRHARIAAGLHI